MASGPYATEDSASRESAASPSTAVSRCCSSWSTATLWPGTVVMATGCHQGRARRGNTGLPSGNNEADLAGNVLGEGQDDDHDDDDDHAHDDQHDRRYG